MKAFAGCLDRYRQTLRFSSRAATAFYADPTRGIRAMRMPFVRRSLVKIYTHGLNVKGLAVDRNVTVLNHPLTARRTERDQ